MFSISQADVLQALKKSRRLAKQDLLACPKTADPPFWTAQAEARRSVYDLLANDVSEYGVELAYRKAAQSYAALPLFHPERGDESPDPVVSGKEKAYEMFFAILGLSEMQLAHLRNARRRRRTGRAGANALERRCRDDLEREERRRTALK